jgi:regulator of sirC expression with transglutaminase-like and TPR domain
VEPAFAHNPEFHRLIARRYGPQDEPDLARIALEIATDVYPSLDIEGYLARVEALAARVRDRCAHLARPRQVLGQINWVLFVEEGFQGNVENYYDPRNSYLNEVIDRRTGIPISLSVLYRRVAAGVGLPLAGVNLPAHFMLRAGQGADTIFVDPFNSGALLDRNDCQRRIAERLGHPITLSARHIAPCPPHLVVARMLRNLKAIYLQNDDFPAAIPVQKRLAALAPDDAQEQRDLALLYLQVDRPAEAIVPLEAYLEACPDNPGADELHVLLRAARRAVAERN